MILNPDCKFYKGDKPCRFNRLCEKCPHYEKSGKNILIIKFGAMGDALRTTPVLRALKKKDKNCRITWLTEKSCMALLSGISEIDRLLEFNAENLVFLLAQEFDLLLSIDKSPVAAGSAMLIKAKKKMGFGISKEGSVFPLNEDADYAFALGLSDELKFRKNRKSYQEYTFESLGMKFAGEEYALKITDEDKRFAKRFLERKGVSEKELTIGLNTGAGDVFATKKWLTENFVSLAEAIHSKTKAKILLLGGPAEAELNKKILSSSKVPLVDATCYSVSSKPSGKEIETIKQFAAIVGECDAIVTSDTLAMHLAVAQKVPALVLFGSTCPQEIDLYGRGEKLYASVDCSPCYRKECQNDGERKMICMKKITTEKVFDSLGKIVSLKK